MKIEEAFDNYHRAVFDYVYRLTRSAALVEDITPECFLALVRAPARFNPARGTMKTYLLSIARNLLLKNYRDRRTVESTESHKSDLATDPRSALEISPAVEHAVAALPHLQQEALVLFQYEGLMLDEIVEVVGADAGTVKSGLFCRSFPTKDSARQAKSAAT